MDRVDRPLALTLGDPAGIGPDITLLAYQARATEPIPPFMLLGDPDVLAARARSLGRCRRHSGDRRSRPPQQGLFAKALPVLPISVSGTVVPGQPGPAAAAADPAINRARSRSHA